MSTFQNYLSQASGGPGAAQAVQGAGQLMQQSSGLNSFWGANAGGAMGAANNQSQWGVQQGQQLANSLNGNLGQAQTDFGYGNQALAQGFNTNNGLYNQEVKDLTDQTRAASSARGIDMTPYGAGVESDTMLHFNQQWQQQQLQNQATAAQTAGTLSAAGQGLQSNYLGAQTAGAAEANQAAMLPSQALSSIMSAGAQSQAGLSAGVSAFLQYLQTSISGASSAMQNRSGMEAYGDYMSPINASAAKNAANATNLGIAA